MRCASTSFEKVSINPPPAWVARLTMAAAVVGAAAGDTVAVSSGVGATLIHRLFQVLPMLARLRPVALAAQHLPHLLTRGLLHALSHRA